MALTNGPNLGLLVNGNAGEGHYSELMKQWRGLDGLVMPNAKGYRTNTPPGSPADGDLYIIGAAPTGAWAGQGGKITRYSTVAAAWEFYTPKNGWMVQSNSAREVYRYTGGAWEIFYQEGTWTPSWVGQTVAGSFTYTEQSGSYLCIGGLVSVQYRIVIASTTTQPTGELRIAGLPFTVGSVHGAGIVNSNNCLNLAESRYIQVPMPLSSTQVMRIWQLGSANNYLADGSQLSSCGTFSGTATYMK